MIFLQIFICLAALYVFLMHPRIRRADSSPFLGTFFAHRGLHDNNHQIPENSLAAFQRAVDAGYGIELDVQLSADRTPVVFHDATLGRMCGIDRRVNELTFAELRQLSLVNTKEHIPSFQEALALVNGKVPLLVELKMEHLDFDIPREADALLSEYSGDYCIESFHPAALYWYRKNRPQIFRGQLSTNFNIENHSLSPFQYLFGKMILNFISRPDFISYKWADRKNPGFLVNKKLFHAPVAAWTLHGEKDLRAAKRSFDMYIFELNDVGGKSPRL